jgi:hypothetical protein
MQFCAVQLRGGEKGRSVVEGNYMRLDANIAARLNVRCNVCLSVVIFPSTLWSPRWYHQSRLIYIYIYIYIYMIIHSSWYLHSPQLFALVKSPHYESSSLCTVLFPPVPEQHPPLYCARGQPIESSVFVCFRVNSSCFTENIYLLIFVLEVPCLFCEVVTRFVNMMSYQQFKILYCHLGYDILEPHSWVLMFWAIPVTGLGGL